MLPPPSSHRRHHRHLIPSMQTKPLDATGTWIWPTLSRASSQPSPPALSTIAATNPLGCHHHLPSRYRQLAQHRCHLVLLAPSRPPDATTTASSRSGPPFHPMHPHGRRPPTLSAMSSRRHRAGLLTPLLAPDLMNVVKNQSNECC